MKRIEADWLGAGATQRMFSLLTDAGHQAYAVGGCVRNTLLGVPVSDIDISTSATPDQVERLAKKAGMRAIPTGKDHGTMTVVINDEPFEVTTFRKDIETDGRRAVVAFTHSVTEDARRRDFTMNAIYAGADGTIVDPLSGMGDVKSRRVRFIEDADARIQEDYLRILRFFRFHAQYGDPDNGIDEDAISAIARNLGGLNGLAAERVGSEMRKLLSAPDPVPALAAMDATGAMAAVLPGASMLFVGPLQHLEAEAQVLPDPIRRLAALGGEDAVSRFRLSRKEANALGRLKKALTEGKHLTEIAFRKGADIAISVALLRSAMSSEPLPAECKSEIEFAARAKFPVQASDLIPDYEGRELGRVLRDLEDQWIASNFRLSRDALLLRAKRG